VIYSITKSPQTYKELNMSYLYTVMQTDVSEFLGSGASYADNKLLLKGLTSNEANAYLGEVYRVDELGFNPGNDEELDGLSTAELLKIADDLTLDIITEEEFNIGTLTVFSKSQGQWLYKNHDSFKPEETEL